MQNVLKQLSLSVLSGQYSISQLPPDAQEQPWMKDSEFYSISRTSDELSVVCSSKNVPPGIKAEKHWRILKVNGPLDFSLTGILSSITAPLASAQIPVFAISTYDTDFILVREDDMKQTIEILMKNGCNISR